MTAAEKICHDALQTYIDADHKPMAWQGACLAFCVTKLLKSCPDLLARYTPGCIDQYNDDLYLMPIKPDPSWSLLRKRRLLYNLKWITDGDVSFTTIMARNFSNLEIEGRTHTLLLGVNPDWRIQIVLIRTADLDWAVTRLGWPRRRVAAGMRAILNTRAERWMDWGWSQTSAAFRLAALSAAVHGSEGCAHCGSCEHLSACGSCGKLKYCGRLCQRRHWPTHKLKCLEMKSWTEVESHLLADI